MDYKFAAEEESLRAELRGFLRDTLGHDWDGNSSDIATEDFEGQREFNRSLAAKGWIAPAWPKQYGGLGASHIEQMIFSEELAYHRAPNGQRVFSVGMIGPTLIVHGTDEQK